MFNLFRVSSHIQQQSEITCNPVKNKTRQEEEENAKCSRDKNVAQHDSGGMLKVETVKFYKLIIKMV